MTSVTSLFAETILNNINMQNDFRSAVNNIRDAIKTQDATKLEQGLLDAVKVGNYFASIIQDPLFKNKLTAVIGSEKVAQLTLVASTYVNVKDLVDAIRHPTKSVQVGQITNIVTNVCDVVTEVAGYAKAVPWVIVGKSCSAISGQIGNNFGDLDIKGSPIPIVTVSDNISMGKSPSGYSLAGSGVTITSTWQVMAIKNGDGTFKEVHVPLKNGSAGSKPPVSYTYSSNGELLSVQYEGKTTNFQHPSRGTTVAGMSNATAMVAQNSQATLTNGKTTSVTAFNDQGEIIGRCEMYVVQKNDTTSQIQAKFGMPPGSLKALNPDITNENQIYAGQQVCVKVEITNQNQSSAPSGTTFGANQFFVDGVFSDSSLIGFATGFTSDAIKAANPGVNFDLPLVFGTLINLPAAQNLFTQTTTTTLGPRLPGAIDPTQALSADNSSLIKTGTYSVLGLGNVNTASGNFAFANDLLTAGLRPAANDLATQIRATQLAKNFLANPELANSVVWAPAARAAALNLIATGQLNSIPTDPLVLDLNGDGVRLTSFGEAPVLFDIDHDGGSKELTGWVSKEDGIVVMDINDNGKIDGISETFSEYFNAAVGTKSYAHGFAALKSLDIGNGTANSAGWNDNEFTSLDAGFANVKVWVDANHDGQTDAGELKTLTQLGITSIALSPTAQSGLVNGGNEVLATGSFTQTVNGTKLTREAQAARFIANPTGNTSAASASGTTVTAQDGQSTYISSSTTGEAIDVSAKGVKNATGGSGNDTLTGDAGANWLIGNQGSDTLNAGAGDDTLLIDAADLQQNIHAGEGFDIVQVIGSAGVTLNLAQAEAEVAVGGTGDDVLIGGGRSTVFIRAGDGDDIVIGGAANDALSGENGNDLIDGGAGNDLIRGGRGQDQLMGGAGDDLLFAGQNDDRLSGGAGNDVLKGEQGDDTLDGGADVDIAEYTGSFADYRITRLSDTTYRIVDSKTGRDGADMLTGIEKLNFADLSAVDLTLDNPLPAKDVITLANRTGLKLIKVADLLANDRDWQGDALRITTISDVKGGSLVGSYNASTQEWTPTLTANGEIQFTPDPAHSGVMGFKYKIADADGTPGATALIVGTTTQAEMRGHVFLTTPELPTDPLFTDQWYLNDINVAPVWKDAYGQGYSGKGVKIGQFEPGMPFSTGPEIFDYRHPDLQANVDMTWLADPANASPGASLIPQEFSQHATLVAGVMVAARDGQGAVGVAYGAKLSGHHFQSSGLGVSELTQEVSNAIAQFRNHDIVNNSWWATPSFVVENALVGELPSGILSAVTQGRNGLGTVVIFGGGNDRAKGGNTNTGAFTNNRATIVVGAINAQTDISTLTIGHSPFSNPGASILVSAPGSNVASTSRILMGDDGTVFGSDTATTEGTSFATPIVSGVVALMLEANPYLGYRDVQQILALSARKVNDANTDTVWNGATNWNGGGMHTSHDYGFGNVDARAAVRLAESWHGTPHTAYNERHLKNGEGSMNGAANLGIALSDGTTVTRTVAMGAGLRAEHVTVSLDVTHSNWGDLTVELISPTGTVSKLMANPGSSTANPGGNVGSGRLTFALDTTHSFGENAQGNWQLRITDRSGRGTGTLNGWRVDAYGSDLNETNAALATNGETPVISTTGNNSYFFTDEFSGAPGANRSTVTDSNGGFDDVNAAAVSTGVTINLTNGSTSTIAGRAVTFSGDIENALGGDGNDALTGNAVSNRLLGGRGNDTLSAGEGLDVLDGGQGSDTLTGGNGGDYFAFRANSGGDTITDFAIGVDRLVLVGMDSVNPTFTQAGADTQVNFGNGNGVLLKNVTATAMTTSSWIHVPADALSQLRVSAQFGSNGHDNVTGSTGSEGIYGGAGNDILMGDPNNTGPGGVDHIDGGTGDDELIGGAGGDRLVGGEGADYVQGGAGDDVIYLEGDYLVGPAKFSLRP